MTIRQLSLDFQQAIYDFFEAVYQYITDNLNGLQGIDSSINSFALQNTTDLGVVNTSVNTVNTSVQQVDSSINSFALQNTTDLGVLDTSVDTVNTSVQQVDSSVNSFALQNNTDLTTLNTSVNTVDTSINTFASQNNTDLTTLNTSVETIYDKDTNLNIVVADTPSADAFGRLRVSNPLTLFNAKQLFDNLPLLFDDQEVSGSGTNSVYNQNKAEVVLSVSNATAGKRVRQTFQRFNYQPGKSLLVFITGTLGLSGGGPGIIRAAGYYDDNNGIFFRDNEGVVEAVVRSSTSGTPVDNAVPQSLWNQDKLDGTGISGITLSPLTSQIIIIDFEWLSIGRVRIGFVIRGRVRYVHHFNHANEVFNAYMSTPNLPIRYEIENTGAGVASSLACICSTVISEGGLERLGVLHHADSDSISAMKTGTTYAMIGIRLASNAIGLDVLIENISLLALTADDVHWELRLNPTVAGTAFTFGAGPLNSNVEVARGDITSEVTGGNDLDGGYFNQSLPASTVVPNALKLGAAIDGTRDVIVLCFTPLSTNLAGIASITWREVL